MWPVKHHVIARAILKVPVGLNRIVGIPDNLFDNELDGVLFVVLAVALAAVPAGVEVRELTRPGQVRIVA